MIHFFPDKGQKIIQYKTLKWGWQKTNLTYEQAEEGLLEAEMELKTKEGKPILTKEELKDYYDIKD